MNPWNRQENRPHLGSHDPTAEFGVGAQRSRDRLGPFAAGHAPGQHLSSSKKNAKKWCGTKKNSMHEQLGQILDQKKTETKKPNCHFWRAWSKNKVLGAKAGYLDMAPCTHHRLRGGQTTEATPPAWPLDTPPLHIKNNLALLQREQASKGACCSHPSAQSCGRVPSKALPEFLVWPLVNFYWLGKAKNPGWHQIYSAQSGTAGEIRAPPEPLDAVFPWVTSGHLNLLFPSHHLC